MASSVLRASCLLAVATCRFSRIAAVRVRALSVPSPPACATSRRHFSAAATEKGTPIKIKTFQDVNRAMRMILLRVHPDVVMSHGDAVTDTNAVSLQELSALLEVVRLRTDAATTAPPIGHSTNKLKPSYNLVFHHVPPAPPEAPSAAAAAPGLLKAEVPVSLPPMFDDQMAVRRG